MKNRSFILIVFMLGLFLSNSLTASSYNQGEFFQLVYTSKGAHLPVEAEFIIHHDGYCVFQKKDTVKKKILELWEFQLSADEFESIAKKMLSEFDFMKLSADLKNPLPVSDAPTDYIEIVHESKSHKIGGYAVKGIKDYQRIFDYMNKKLAQLKSEAVKPQKPSAPENFYLEYSVQGSEYPVQIKMRVFASGKVSFSEKKPQYGESMGSLSTYDYALKKEDFELLKKKIIVELKFFQLPFIDKNDPRLEKMDGATSFITVSYKGKLHRIGGYNASSFAEYQGVFLLMRNLQEKIKKEGKKTGLDGLK